MLVAYVIGTCLGIQLSTSAQCIILKDQLLYLWIIDAATATVQFPSSASNEKHCKSYTTLVDASFSFDSLGLIICSTCTESHQVAIYSKLDAGVAKAESLQHR